MHRAVAARLADHEISLFEALRIGGFEYPTNDDASVVDAEKVTLGQRKNQLSRRLRLARKQNLFQEAHDDSQDGPGKIIHSVKCLQNSKTFKRKPRNSIAAGGLHMRKEPAEFGVSDEDVDPDARLLQDEPSKRQRIAKFQPDFAPLFVHPSSSVRQNGHKSNGGSQAHNVPSHLSPNFGTSQASSLILGTNGFGTSLSLPQPSLFNQQISKTQQGKPRASAVAISSLNSSAEAVGMTLEQLAMTLASNTTNLAKVLAEGNSIDAFTKQQELALHFYETESKALYSKCMLLAGIDPRMCQANTPTHLQFALKAWQAEGKRLHDLIGNPRGLGEQPLDVPNVRNQKKVSYTKHTSSTSCGNESTCSQKSWDKNAGECEVAVCDAPHVHRLDGQCGHKAIIHQPKEGTPHIDFVIGDKVECYDGVVPLGQNIDSIWPSRFKCADVEDCCSNKCGRNNSAMNEALDKGDSLLTEPKIIQLSDINLQDPEWNYDVSGSNNDGGVVGLLKLGNPGDNISSI